MEHVRFLVVGAGIAGMSLASRLVGHRRSVKVLEMEDTAPKHATGRSASLVDVIYVPNASVGALAMASGSLFDSLAHTLHPKASLHLYGKGHLHELTDSIARCDAVGAEIELLEPHEVEERFPFLRGNEEFCRAALHAPAGASHTIDVEALYAHYRSIFHRHGGHTLHVEELVSAHYSGGAWTVRTSHEVLRADVIVNCAGAWADIVAARCHVTPLGLVPLKRTVVETTLAPHPLSPQPEGPFVFWNSHDPLYADFKRHGRALVSLADEQVSQPCDAKAEKHDLETALDRLLHRTHLNLAGLHSRHWAGLRTFAADRKPVIGWSDEVHGFFWSAAYGGFGIECSPAASLLAADMLLGEKHFTELANRHGIESGHFAPERLHPVPVHHV